MAEGFRIVHCIDSLGIGGAQAMLFNLYNAVKKYYPHIRQTVILTNAGKVDTTYVESHNVEFAHLQRSLIPRTLFEMGGKEKVVFLYHKLMSSDTTFFRRIFPKIPIVLINHTFTKHFTYNKISHCNAVVCVSKHMVDTLKKQNPRHRYEVIRNTVDIEDFEDVEPYDRNGKDEGYFITGRINSFNKIKYSDDWVKWCIKVDLPVKMIHEYVGGGMFYRPCRKLIQRMEKKYPGMNTVRTTGQIRSFEEKVARLKSWDITLYEINRDEGISVSLLESLACGVPVVCCNHYGNKEIIRNGVNGYVFESKGELKGILTELSLNPQIVQDLRKSTKAHFKEKLDIKVAAAKYYKLFEDVIVEGDKAKRLFNPPVKKKKARQPVPRRKRVR